jgi:8-oxo-dGTP pyrophosphatase MutT (NUDIX family)
MPFDDALRQRLLDLVETHAEAQAGRAAEAVLFQRFIHAHPACCERSLGIGHLTGSAWVVDRAGRRALLTHHRKLDRWLQPGGHADGDADLARVALRETEEETGLAGLVVEPTVFDLDRHWIPARGAEPGHWHYDLRFVVRATAGEDFVVSDESHALAWVAIDAIAADAGYDDSLRRMAASWLGGQRAILL